MFTSVFLRRVGAATAVFAIVAASLAVVRAKDLSHNTALGFVAYGWGGGAVASGAVVPRQDNVRISAWLKWAGPTGAMFGQTAVYNGNSACSGFGIWVNDNGTLAVLLGGVTWLQTDASIGANQWHQVEVSRVNGAFTVAVDEVPATVFYNTTAPNPIGFCGSEALTVGNGTGATYYPGAIAPDAFNGAIDNVRVKSLGGGANVNLFWHLDEGTGTVARDIHGVKLTVTGTAWVAGHEDE